MPIFPIRPIGPLVVVAMAEMGVGIGDLAMFSPYEELEYISDFLPNEGESVVLRREGGELVCQPITRDQLRDGVDESDLYGRLVQANERLASAYSLPMWVGVIGLVWLAIGLHAGLGLTWSQWFLVPGLSFPVMYLCVHWGKRRQEAVFRQDILPGLRSEMLRRDISHFQLISGVRQHAELRNLLDELIRWSPAADPIQWQYR